MSSSGVARERARALFQQVLEAGHVALKGTVASSCDVTLEAKTRDASSCLSSSHSTEASLKAISHEVAAAVEAAVWACAMPSDVPSHRDASRCGDAGQDATTTASESASKTAGLIAVQRPYSELCRSLLRALRLPCNNEVCSQLLRKSLDGQSLLRLEANGGLLPEVERLRRIRTATEEANNSALKRDHSWLGPSLETDALECVTCGSFEVRYERILPTAVFQKPDGHGSKIFCRCRVCGHSWRTDENAL